MANFRSGYLKQGDPLGMTQREFQMAKGTRTGKPFRIDAKGLSLVRIMGIADQSSVETVAVDGLDATLDAVSGVVTVTQVGHLLEVGSRIKLKGASGFTNLGQAMGKLGNPFQAITAVSYDTFSYESDAGAMGALTGKIAYQMEAIETPVVLNDGVEKNQQLILECANKSTWSLDTANIDILDTWIPAEFDTITLYWDGYSKWVGLSDQIRSGEDIRYQDGVIYGDSMETLGEQNLVMLPAPGVGLYNKIEYIQMDQDEYPAALQVAGVAATSAIVGLNSVVTVTSAAHGLAPGDIIVVTAQTGLGAPVTLTTQQDELRTVDVAGHGVGVFQYTVTGTAVAAGPGTIDYTVIWQTDNLLNSMRMFPSSGVDPVGTLYPYIDVRPVMLQSTKATGCFLSQQRDFMMGTFYKFSQVETIPTGGIQEVDLSNKQFLIKAVVNATGAAAGAGAVKPTGAGALAIIKDSSIRYRIKYQVRSVTDLQ